MTVASIPEDCTTGTESSISTTVAGIPTILPMQVPQEVGVSDISAAFSSVLQDQDSGTATSELPSAASSALSEASALLSSMVATAPVATPGSTGAAPTVSATTTATSTSSATTTASTTTTTSPSMSGLTSPWLPITSTGAASEYSVSAGLVLSLLVGLAANVAFLI